MSSLIYYSDYQIVINLWNQKKEDKSFNLSSMVAGGGLEPPTSGL